jgi:hypothetical protein
MRGRDPLPFVVSDGRRRTREGDLRSGDLASGSSSMCDRMKFDRAIADRRAVI